MKDKKIESKNKLVLFQSKKIRRIWHEEEIENPELAQERMKELYEQKGYSKDWIDKRLRGIAIRQNLTDEWEERGIEDQRDYAILTAEISKEEKPATFNKSKNVAKRGGKVAGNARKETEKELGRSVISNKNYLENNKLGIVENSTKI